MYGENKVTPPGPGLGCFHISALKSKNGWTDLTQIWSGGLWQVVVPFCFQNSRPGNALLVPSGRIKITVLSNFLLGVY